MRLIRSCAVYFITPLLIWGVSGCGSESLTGTDDPGSSTPTSQGARLNLSDYGDLLAEVAPPLFAAASAPPSAAPATEGWTTGDYPLLGKVFSENEPMSIYRNINDLDAIIVMIEDALAQWEFEQSGSDSTTGSAADSSASEETVNSDGGSVVVTPRTDPIAVPAAYQSLLGTTVDLDYTIVFTANDYPDMDLHFGFSQSETRETILGFHAQDYPSDGTPESMDSFVFYAHRDLATDEITVKGLFCKQMYADDTYAKWIYDFSTESDSTFTYRTAWYAASPEFVGSMIGAGDRDVEFALRYQQYYAPDFNAVEPNDPWGNLTQVFGPNYSDLGTTFDETWEAATLETNMFTGDDMPLGLLSSPFPNSDN